MDLDQITRASTPAQAPTAYAGRISRLDGGVAYVVIPSLSTEYHHGPVKVSSGGAPPAVGTEVLVTFDETNLPWIAPAPPTPPPTPPSHIGEIITWSRVALPSDCVLANGQTLTGAAYPQAYAAAQAEVAAGNTLWTVNTGAGTFTVPNLSDKFVYGKGTKALGVTGGEENHTLTVGEMPSHNHGGATGTGSTGTGSTGTGTTGTDSPDHAHGLPANAVTNGVAGGNLGSAGSYNQGLSPLTGGANTRHAHAIPSLSIPALSVPALSISSQGGGGAHNNMPPYIVLAQLVRVRD